MKRTIAIAALVMVIGCGQEPGVVESQTSALTVQDCISDATGKKDQVCHMAQERCHGHSRNGWHLKSEYDLIDVSIKACEQAHVQHTLDFIAGPNGCTSVALNASCPNPSIPCSGGQVCQNGTCTTPAPVAPPVANPPTVAMCTPDIISLCGTLCCVGDSTGSIGCSDGYTAFPGSFSNCADGTLAQP